MIISACTDEISHDLEVALDVLTEEGIEYLDLRGIWGKNVTGLDDDEAAKAKDMIERRGFQVTAISTPIGKTQITDDFEPDIARFQRALELATLLGAPYVRVFSYYVADAEAETFRGEALNRLRHLCTMAQPHNIVLAHENEEGGFCAWRPEECVAFHQALPDNFRALFEPCSFAVMNYEPAVDALPQLRPYIAYVHVRDTERGTTRYGVVGEGDVGWREILSELKQSGFQGYLTLEPHLQWANRNATDADRTASFRRATQALRHMLNDL